MMSASWALSDQNLQRDMAGSALAERDVCDA
jgi:hypothetical protein